MKIVNLIAVCMVIFNISLYSQNDKFRGEEISFPSLDGLQITADIYEADVESEIYILLFHQAAFSRGSYRTIAPKLNELGYHCLAVDQRSGSRSRGVINSTSKRAKKANTPIRYMDAVQDVESAFLYAKNELKAKKIILWGSSYSASIVLYIGGKYPGEIDGILSFSPGEYFTIEGKTIESFVKEITAPVFFTSAKNEKKEWKSIYNNISSEKEYYLPEKSGFHGSKALWFEKEGNELYWEAVISFLKTIHKTD